MADEDTIELDFKDIRNQVVISMPASHPAMEGRWAMRRRRQTAMIWQLAGLFFVISLVFNLISIGFFLTEPPIDYYASNENSDLWTLSPQDVQIAEDGSVRPVMVQAQASSGQAPAAQPVAPQQAPVAATPVAPPAGQ